MSTERKKRQSWWPPAQPDEVASFLKDILEARDTAPVPGSRDYSTSTRPEVIKDNTDLRALCKQKQKRLQEAVLILQGTNYENRSLRRSEEVLETKNKEQLAQIAEHEKTLSREGKAALDQEFKLKAYLLQAQNENRQLQSREFRHLAKIANLEQTIKQFKDDKNNWTAEKALRDEKIDELHSSVARLESDAAFANNEKDDLIQYMRHVAAEERVFRTALKSIHKYNPRVAGDCSVEQVVAFSAVRVLENPEFAGWFKPGFADRFLAHESARDFHELAGDSDDDGEQDIPEKPHNESGESETEEWTTILSSPVSAKEPAQKKPSYDKTKFLFGCVPRRSRPDYESISGLLSPQSPAGALRRSPRNGRSAEVSGWASSSDEDDDESATPSTNSRAPIAKRPRDPDSMSPCPKKRLSRESPSTDDTTPTRMTLRPRKDVNYRMRRSGRRRRRS
jgi:hypothetical protein